VQHWGVLHTFGLDVIA